MMEGFSVALPDQHSAQDVYRLQYKLLARALILQAINALRRIVVWLCETVGRIVLSRLKKQGRLSIEKLVLVCGRAVISR